MARQQRKQQIVKNEQGQGHLVEEIFDDNLLPDASEIERLHKIDPDILNWLKKSAEKEQEFRHKAYDERIRLVKDANRGDRLINKLGVWFSLIIALSGMCFSAFLILHGHEILGSIFAGGTLLGMVSLFLSKVDKQSEKGK